jgi:ankyrin repeat protein
MITKTRFLNSSKKGNVRIIKQYIQEGSDVNIQTNYGWTALMFASMNNHKKIVRILLDANADVNIRNKDGKTVIIQTGNNEIINIHSVQIVSNQRRPNVSPHLQ